MDWDLWPDPIKNELLTHWALLGIKNPETYRWIKGRYSNC